MHDGFNSQSKIVGRCSGNTLEAKTTQRSHKILVRFLTQRWPGLSDHIHLHFPLLVGGGTYGCFQKLGVFPPKWMVYNGKPYEQMGWFGGFLTPPIFWVEISPIWEHLPHQVTIRGSSTHLHQVLRGRRQQKTMVKTTDRREELHACCYGYDLILGDSSKARRLQRLISCMLGWFFADIERFSVFSLFFRIWIIDDTLTMFYRQARDTIASP